MKIVVVKVFLLAVLTGMYIQVYAQNDRQNEIINSVKKKYGSSNNGKLLVNGEKCWLSLYDSKDKLNVIGDFMKLVDQIVESTGGETEFGGLLIPAPKPIIVDSDFEMNSNF